MCNWYLPWVSSESAQWYSIDSKTPPAICCIEPHFFSQYFSQEFSSDTRVSCPLLRSIIFSEAVFLLYLSKSNVFREAVFYTTKLAVKNVFIQLIEAWSHAPADIQLKEGGSFTLFKGMVSGKFTELVGFLVDFVLSFTISVFCEPVKQFYFSVLS